MPTTFTIPLVTLPVGARQFGPTHPADTEGAIVLTIDRTVTAGLNSLAADSTITTDVEQSNDGGASWQDLGGTVFPGGLYFSAKTGANAAASTGRWNLIPGTSRQLRATVTVSGPASIAVAGTIVTS
jgi:hypothetical protein